MVPTVIAAKLQLYSHHRIPPTMAISTRVGRILKVMKRSTNSMPLVPRSMTRLRPPVWRSRWKRSEEHTSELQSLMRISYAVFCLKKKKTKKTIQEREIEETRHKQTRQIK